MRQSSHMKRQGRTVIFSAAIQDGLMMNQFLSNSDIKDHQVSNLHWSDGLSLVLLGLKFIGKVFLIMSITLHT